MSRKKVMYITVRPLGQDESTSTAFLRDSQVEK
jgi:hypothetical protein